MAPYQAQVAFIVHLSVQPSTQYMHPLTRFLRRRLNRPSGERTPRPTMRDFESVRPPRFVPRGVMARRHPCPEAHGDVPNVMRLKCLRSCALAWSDILEGRKLYKTTHDVVTTFGKNRIKSPKGFKLLAITPTCTIRVQHHRRRHYSLLGTLLRVTHAAFAAVADTSVHYSGEEESRISSFTTAKGVARHLLPSTNYAAHPQPRTTVAGLR